jgi:outer membrane protein assembly factor BamB
VATTILLLLFPAVAAADDWPQFRGLHRDGTSAEKGLLRSWPAAGPELLWSYDALGFGYSSVAVVGNRVYSAGGKGDQMVVTALDTAGKKIWETPIGRTNAAGYAGPRSTPTVNGDHLYVLGDEGDLACLKTADGTVVWTKNILREYQAANIGWKLSESILVDGDRVICQPGGKASMVALDKLTGAEVWAAEPVDLKTGYASAMIVDHKSLKQIVGHSSGHIFGVREKDGKLLWKQPQKNKCEVNATNVVFDKGIVFSSCGYGLGSQALRLKVSGQEASVDQVWAAKDLDDHFGGVVLLKNLVFGTPTRGALLAVDLGTGAVKMKATEVGKSSIIYADGRLYCQCHDGRVLLVDPATGKVAGSFMETPAQKGQLWAHPAIAGGVFYLRNGDILKAFKVK